MKKNGFAPLLIILVIAILGAVGYFAYKNYFIKKSVSIFPSSSPQSQNNLFIPQGYISKLTRVKTPNAEEMYYKTQLTDSKGNNIFFFELPFNSVDVCNNYQVNNISGCRSIVKNVCLENNTVPGSLVCGGNNETRTMEEVILKDGLLFYSQDVNLSDTNIKNFINSYFNVFHDYLQYR